MKRRTVGSHQDIAAVRAHFTSVDPIIAPVVTGTDYSDRFGVAAPADFFARLCHDIIGQQLSVKVADVISQRFRALVGEDAVLTPAIVLGVEGDALRAQGLSWAKIKYVKDLADKVASGEVNLTDLPSLPDEAVIEELVKVKGIGRWTAEMFLIFTLGRTDVFSLGDLGLRRAVERLYHIPAVSNDQMTAITQTWSPYRSFGSIALWRSLDEN